MSDSYIVYSVAFGIIIIVGLIYYLTKVAVFSGKMDTIIKWMKLKDYQKAISMLKPLINKDDNNSEAHFYLAECYIETKNYEWALPEYKKVLRINKYPKEGFTESHVRRRMADIYLFYNQLEEAQKEFLLVTKLEPDNHKNYYEIGRIFLERHHSDQAAQYVRKALELNPNHADSLYLSGVIKYNSRLYSEALLELEKCISIDKYNYKANYYIGMVNYQVKNYQKALEQLDIGQREREFRSKALLQRGVIFVELGETDSAIVEMEKAKGYIEEEDDFACKIRYQLAECYEQKKDIASAIEQWESIEKTYPEYRDVAEKLANYQELRMDDKLKDFFVASTDAFENICRQALKKINIEVKETTLLRSVSAEFIAHERLGTKDVRVQRVIVRVYRYNEPIGDGIVRDMVERLKKESGTHRGICISATSFTKQAIDFSETRPIQLIAGQELAKLLKQI